jgi:hypothetical protein
MIRTSGRLRFILHWAFVLVFLAFLFVLVLSAQWRARESNRRVLCRNRLKGLGLALMQYSQDYRHMSPWRIGARDPHEGWRDLGLLFPGYQCDSRSFFCPSSMDNRGYLDREFFRDRRELARKPSSMPQPIKDSGPRAVISYSYSFDATGGGDGKDKTCLPWATGAKGAVRILADKKAGVTMTAESAHKSRQGKPHGRNVLYHDGSVRFNKHTGGLDPDPEDDNVGKPGARDYTDWWSDPPFYGE